MIDITPLSQILTIVGLFFEFLSVAYVARNVFPTKSKKERKMKWIEEHGKTLGNQIESEAKEWYIVLGLLFIGMILQAIAVFV